MAEGQQLTSSVSEGRREEEGEREVGRVGIAARPEGRR